MTYALFKVLGANNQWHDYSDIVKVKGLSWQRNDRYASSVEMTLDKSLHRVKVANKRKLTYQLTGADIERYAALDDDLSQPIVKVQYNDLHGIMTKDFICTAFSATVDYYVNIYPQSYTHTSGGSFTLEEV